MLAFSGRLSDAPFMRSTLDPYIMTSICMQQLTITDSTNEHFRSLDLALFTIRLVLHVLSDLSGYKRVKTGE